MAYNNIEVEIKIEVTKNAFETARTQLTGIAEWKESSQQIDTYYALRETGFLGQEKFPYKWLSVRERHGKTLLNYKHYYPEGTEKHHYCNEYETEVTDVAMITRIFDGLGMKKIAIVDKIREKYIFNDEFEIALDTVKDLGYFIEVEALKDQGGIETTRRKVDDFIASLHSKDFRVEHRGYPFIMVEKQQRG